MIISSESNEYRQIKDIFFAALDVVPGERSRFLADNCPNSRILAEVKSLFEAREEAGDFLNDISAVDTIQNLQEHNEKLTGRKIGAYQLEKEIGRGGMGIVFLANREDFRQQAAVKLIKRGMDSDVILERFTREREILAALNHPHIARLTDGGTTEDNLPYFVMEYVEGEPVDKYCRDNEISPKDILLLFRRICEAVAFAHQKLVVHRDLKPSNILVTADGTPKLLDFGIAKLLNVTDASDTQTQQRVLTPAYASPEQISGKPIDTTSDVYSLGKILAELLGCADFAMNTTGRKTTSAAAKSKLDTDLQNILKMAMREESSRRYNSVEKFSEDVCRYLAGLPVTARKDTFAYRTAKFLRRKSYAVAFAGLFLLTILSGMFATLWQAREARREREIAERRFENLRKVSSSFVTDLHTAIQDLPGSLPARQLLLRQAVEQLDALAAESGDNPVIQDELAQAYLNSAQLPDMLLAEKDATLKKEIDIYQNLTVKEPDNTHYMEQLALGKMELGDVTKVRGSVANGIALEKQGIDLLERITALEPDKIEHWTNLALGYINIASLYILQGSITDAMRSTQNELAAVEKIKLLNPNEPKYNQLFNIGRSQLGGEQGLSGNYQTAIGLVTETLAYYQSEQVKTPSDTRVKYRLWGGNRRLAEVYTESGDGKKALAHWQEALSIIESLVSENPHDLGYYRNAALTDIFYGQRLVSNNHPADAIKNFRRALELSEKVLETDAGNAESKADDARANANLGRALVLTGKSGEGLDYLEKADRIFREICPLDTENAELQRDYAQAFNWLNEVKTERGIKK